MNKSFRRRITAAFLLLTMLVSGGCSIAGRRVYFSTSGWPMHIMKIGPITCDRKDVRVYLANYLNIYGHAGSEDLWAAGNDKYEEGIKNAIISHLSRVCSLELYAKENAIMLTADEEKSVQSAAKKYFKSLTDKEISYMGVSEKDIGVMYTRYALAEKVYDSLMGAVDEDISEDEARIMDAYVIYVKKKKTAKKVEKELEDGADFKSLTDRYTEGEKGKLSFGRNTYPASVEEVCFRLENGEVSKAVKADDGYYFVSCESKYNRKLSEKNKEKIISQKKETLLAGIVKDQSEKYYSYLNTEMLEAIHVEDRDVITTESFFTTLDEYITF